MVAADTAGASRQNVVGQLGRRRLAGVLLVALTAALRTHGPIIWRPATTGVINIECRMPNIETISNS